MIVDDDHAILTSLSPFFEKDYDVIAMDNGPDALRYLKETRIPDLVVLDMEMPKLNGRVFVRRIKFDITHKKIPIVLISAIDSHLIINSFLKLGVEDYVVKPFETTVLINKILNIINLKADNN
jgi:DNA-binding response OmpR family regulator